MKGWGLEGWAGEGAAKCRLGSRLAAPTWSMRVSMIMILRARSCMVNWVRGSRREGLGLEAVHSTRRDGKVNEEVQTNKQASGKRGQCVRQQRQG